MIILFYHVNRFQFIHHFLDFKICSLRYNFFFLFAFSFSYVDVRHVLISIHKKTKKKIFFLSHNVLRTRDFCCFPFHCSLTYREEKDINSKWNTNHIHPLEKLIITTTKIIVNFVFVQFNYCMKYANTILWLVTTMLCDLIISILHKTFFEKKNYSQKEKHELHCVGSQTTLINVFISSIWPSL